MSRAIQGPVAQPNVVQSAVAPQVPVQPVAPRDRASRSEPSTKQGSSPSSSSSASTENKSALGTSVGVPVQPNTPRQDAGQRGGGQGTGQGSDGPIAQAVRGAQETSIARVVSEGGSVEHAAALLGMGPDHVLLNVGKHGRHTFATGSLVPRKYLRHYNKLTLGRRTDPWEQDEDETSSSGAAPLSAEEYEAIVREMARARINAGRSVLEASARLPHRQKAKAG